MTPKFAQAVDPIFLQVITLLERIAQGELPVVTEERTRIRRKFDDAESLLGGGSEWQLAKYALAAWADAMLSEAPWESRDWWNNNALEVEFFRTREAYREFYVKANEATESARKDALEVFYVCVMLGFRGMYASPVVHEAESLGLPAELSGWSRQVGLAIQLGKGRPTIVEKSQPGPGAPPLEGKFLMVGASLLTVVLAAFTVILGYAFLIRG